jgi:hypothetical protein
MSAPPIAADKGSKGAIKTTRCLKCLIFFHADSDGAAMYRGLRKPGTSPISLYAWERELMKFL